MIKSYPILLASILLLCLLCSVSKKNEWVKFKKLSDPEKYWVVTHPFIAKRTLGISILAVTVSEKIQKENILDQEINGGKLDAFRHAYWMALLA